MTNREFEIAEYERDREATEQDLAECVGRPGMGAYVDKYTAQLARIEQRLAQLRPQRGT